MCTPRFLGRLRIIKQLTSENKFSLSVGCKDTRIASINLDIARQYFPDIVADARYLPFKPNTFTRIFFTDVIQYIPGDGEVRALSEINRVLIEGGELILTAPNRILLFTITDLSHYLIGQEQRQKRYGREEISRFLEITGFKAVRLFTSGLFWAMLNWFFYCLVTYPVKKLTHFHLPYVPSAFENQEDKEFHEIQNSGYTIFVKAIKRNMCNQQRRCLTPSTT